MNKLKMYLPPTIQNSSIGSQLRCEHTVSEDAVDLQFFGVVGEWWDGITSNVVGKILSKNKGKRVNVLINSPGGYASEGIAIYNLLCEHDGEVVTTCVGDASSAASHILMAGDDRRMYDNASFLVHRCLGAFVANAGEMRAIADDMELMDRGIATVYANRAGGSVDKWLDIMAGPKDRDGTTYSAQKALDAGLIDAILKSGPATKTPSNERLLQAARSTVIPSEYFNDADTVRKNVLVDVRLRLIEIDNQESFAIL